MRDEYERSDDSYSSLITHHFVLRLVLIFLVLLWRLFGRRGRWHDIEQRLDAGAISLGDFHVSIVAQFLQVILPRFRRALAGDRLTHIVLIECRSVAARAARIDAQNLIAFVSFLRLTYAAGLDVLNCRGYVRPQIGHLKKANFTRLLTAVRRPIRIGRGQRAKVCSGAQLVYQLRRPRSDLRVLFTGKAKEYL